MNYHTRYYRAAEGLQKDESVSAASYVRSKLVTHPLTSIDTLSGGLFTFPMSNKWHSYDAWMPGLGRCLLWLAAAGMVAALLRTGWASAARAALQFADPVRVDVDRWRRQGMALHRTCVPDLYRSRVRRRAPRGARGQAVEGLTALTSSLDPVVSVAGDRARDGAAP